MKVASSGTITPGGGDDAQGGAGVLGWLGFVVINVAAWGFIGVSSTLAWPLGLGICVVYTAVLIGLAIWLEKKGQGQRFRQFINLLWVLACLFVMVSGTFFSVNVFHSGDNYSSDWEEHVDGPRVDWVTALPNQSSAELRSWAESESNDRLPAYALFSGKTYFNARSNDSSRDLLHYADGMTSGIVTPELQYACLFRTFQNELVFVTDSDDVWSINSLGPGVARRITDLQSEQLDAYSRINIRSLFVENLPSRLYIKVTYSCPDSYSQSKRTIFVMNGISEGATDLLDNQCSDTTTTRRPSYHGRSHRAEQIGTLVLGVLPMLALASFVLATRKLPGVFLNLFVGVYGAIVLIYVITRQDGSEDIFTFAKWTFTPYTAILWVGIIVGSITLLHKPDWVEELITWAVTLVAPSFFVIVHIDLELFLWWVGEPWAWFVFAAIVLLQMGASTLIARTLPMILSAVGAFEIAGKISYTIVADLLGLENELQMLIMFALLGIEGLGIILGAIFYASRRGTVETSVRSFLLKVGERFQSVDEEETEA